MHAAGSLSSPHPPSAKIAAPTAKPNARALFMHGPPDDKAVILPDRTLRPQQD
jgi:hypothetical protein